MLQVAPQSDTLPDMVLEDGDRIVMPSTPGFVAAFGAVNNENVFVHKPGRTVDDVLRIAGVTEDGELDQAFVLRADGTVGPVIPERIITRPPSAELRPDQTDQDSLPPYEVLDAIIERYMENDRSPDSIVAEGFAQADVDKVVRLIRINEYKRRQAPVGVRVTHRSFGKDWRYPITSKYRA